MKSHTSCSLVGLGLLALALDTAASQPATVHYVSHRMPVQGPQRELAADRPRIAHATSAHARVTGEILKLGKSVLKPAMACFGDSTGNILDFL